MASKTATTGISICKNRTYSNDLTWTDEMNSNLHTLYLQARSNPEKDGYTNTLKRLWDEKFPDYSHLSVKHISQQARNVDKRLKRANDLQQPDHQDPQQVQQQLEQEQQPPAEPPAEPPPQVANTDKEVENAILTGKLKETFLCNCEKYQNVELHNREYSTRCDFKLDPKVMEEINVIINDYKNTFTELTFWDINVICYASAITLIETYGKLKECKAGGNSVSRKQPWELQLTNQISSIRRKISHITLTQECIAKNSFTKKQKIVSANVKKLCGSLQKEKLSSKLALLKHDLLVCNTKLTDMRTKAERSRINTQFFKNQKQVFRDWKGEKVEVVNPPTIENARKFWADIWQKDTPINIETDWYRKLQDTYCTNASTKDYQIDPDVFEKVVARTPNNKAPGRDLITGLWIKRLTAIHEDLIELYNKAFRQEIDIPEWLIISKTILLPKNKNTHMEKNYRPIACLNTMYKIYTGILNVFIEDHCSTNDIITLEQAGGKKGSWGCSDQLLINKLVLDEVGKYRRNLFCIDTTPVVI